MPCVERALIVGAGIAGLALARRFAASGIQVTILERRLPADAFGAGILLTGNAMRALEALGLAQLVRERGTPVARIRYTDEVDRELFVVDLAARPAWPAFTSIQRDVLQGILLAGAPVQPLWGVTLAAAEPRHDAIDARFSNGARGSFDLVVGADGVHSHIRSLLLQSPTPEPLPGLCGWRFVAPLPAGLDAPQYMLGNGRTLLLHPLPGGLVYCGAGPVVESEIEGSGDLERMRHAFAGFGGHAAGLLAGVSEHIRLIPTRYWSVEAAAWHAGNCVLVGDAAHACAPTLAQGGAMALEDALVLGELVDGHARLEDALRAFEVRRSPRVRLAQARSLRRLAANRLLQPRARALRDAVLARIGAAQLLDAWAPLMERSP